MKRNVSLIILTRICSISFWGPKFKSVLGQSQQEGNALVRHFDVAVVSGWELNIPPPLVTCLGGKLLEHLPQPVAFGFARNEGPI
jgi:hypothetical protein